MAPGQSRPRSCQATPGQIEVCSDAYGPNGWLGLAQIWANRTAHITQGTAQVNDTYYTAGSKYDTPEWRAAVVCQEVGHAFGLDHQDTSGADFHTCMDDADNPATDNMHPNQHDYQQLATIYGSHLDTLTTIGATKGNTSPTSVTRTDRIANSTIVERYADGSSKTTFIVWAVGSRS